MTNDAIAAVFDHVADLIEYQGGNVFRVRAYRNAARSIGSLVESLASVRADASRSLTDLDGKALRVRNALGQPVTVEGVPLIGSNLRATNGVVHVVQGLLPAAPSSTP